MLTGFTLDVRVTGFKSGSLKGEKSLTPYMA